MMSYSDYYRQQPQMGSRYNTSQTMTPNPFTYGGFAAPGLGNGMNIHASPLPYQGTVATRTTQPNGMPDERFKGKPWWVSEEEWLKMQNPPQRPVMVPYATR